MRKYIALKGAQSNCKNKNFFLKGSPTSLICSTSYFNLGVEAFFKELSGDGTEFDEIVGPQLVGDAALIAA